MLTDEAIKAIAAQYLAHKDTVNPTIRGWAEIVAMVRVCLAAEREAQKHG